MTSRKRASGARAISASTAAVTSRSSPMIMLTRGGSAARPCRRSLRQEHAGPRRLARLEIAMRLRDVGERVALRDVDLDLPAGDNGEEIVRHRLRRLARRD